MSKNRNYSGELLLEAKNISKYYGDRQIFKTDLLQLYAGEHVGIVGMNGSGKTTLMEILAGIRPPDSGSVRSFAQVSYISQFDDGAQQDTDLDASMRKFVGKGDMSGGERMRLRIANVLQSGTALLMADEPTSNLDFDGIELLERELWGVETLLLISHDRALLDTFCHRILEIRSGEIHEYMGNYSDYMRQRDAAHDRALFEYESYATEKKRLEKSLQKRRERAEKMTDTPSRMGNSEARLHRMEVRQRKGKVQQTSALLRSRLESIETKEKPRELAPVYIDLRLTKPPANKIVLTAKDVHFSYGKREILSGAHFEVPNGAKYALIGPNGSGKSTLLHLIRDGYPGLQMPPQAKCGMLAQQFEDMDLEKSALDNILRDSVQNQQTCRNILARLLLRGDTVLRPVKSLSGGERIKLGLAKLIVSDANVLLLDEPTNYLDLPSLEALQQMLKEYAGTVIFASHDRTFIDEVATGLLLLKNGEIERYAGNWSAYREKDKRKPEDNMELVRWQMRQAEVAAALGASNISNTDREALEEEFQHINSKLQRLQA